MASLYPVKKRLVLRKLIPLISTDSADVDTSPTLTAGTAAPTAVEPNGSIYLRTNGSVYKRQSSAWEILPDFTDTEAVQDQIDDHEDGGASKHDGTEIDFELADGSKKNIQAGSDTVEAAITDIDIALDAHKDGGASKHDATEIDFELADGSKKNIQAGSDTVEAAITDLDTGLAKIVTTALAVTGGVGGSTDGTLSLNVKTLLGANVTAIRQVVIGVTSAQYSGAYKNTVTFSTATTGAIIASGAGWCLAQTSTTGVFACTISDSADETVYVSCSTPMGGVSVIGETSIVSPMVPVSGTWSA